MPLLEKNQFTEDKWQDLADDAPLPTSHSDALPLIVSWQRLQTDTALASVTGPLGVRLENTEQIESLEGYLAKLQLISLPFPKFGDGRAYSLARQIRGAGFKGDLRAVGDILPDQYQMMLEVGFTSFMVSDRFALSVWQRAGQQMSLVYQRGLYRPHGEVEIWPAREGKK